MNKNGWRQWIRGVVGGFIGGGASAVTAGMSVAMIDPEHFVASGTWPMLELMVGCFVVNGAIGTLLYLKQHPLPEDGQ